MSWLRTDDDMLDHEKWRRAIRNGGDGVLLMWWRFASWSSRQRTDGIVPGDVVDDVGVTRARSRQLLALIDARLLAWVAPGQDSLSVRRGLTEPEPRGRHVGDNLVVVGYLVPGIVDERMRREARLARAVSSDEVCAYCGNRSERMTIDHVIPLCQGGGNDPENLVVACGGCNSRKGGRTPEQAGMTLLAEVWS
jgi:hypothetical protein